MDLLESIKTIDLKQYINLDKLTEYAKGVMNVAGKILDFFVAIIVSIYLLLQRKDILEFIKKLGKVTLKESTYKNMGKYFDRTNNIFFNFLAGQLFRWFNNWYNIIYSNVNNWCKICCFIRIYDWYI